MTNTNKLTKGLPYDKTSAISIYEYSKGLLGKSLREFVYDGYSQREGKGGIGQMVENLYFLLETNNNPEADFSSAGMELKCTPLKLAKNNDYLIKERLVCNMINYKEVVNEDFEHSHFYIKCQLMLLIFYLHKKGYDKLDFEFIFSVLWKLPEKDLLIIRKDYETIIEKIRRGEAHLLSEGDTMYLGACRKGQKGDSLMSQPYSSEGAPRRAFSLKMAYMRTVLQYVLDSGQNAVANFTIPTNQLVSEKELNELGFDEILLNRFKPYIGQNFQLIAAEKGVNLSNNPKNKFAMIANAIASSNQYSNINLSEEFIKAGLTMKTIRVQHNGTIKEAMSFENIDYIEVADCYDWFESRLYELFSSRFMFVVYKEQTKNQGDYILDDVFFWTMPQEDLALAEEYWNHIRKNILNDHISEEYWWKGRDKKKFHVRPKAQKSTNLVPTPNGGWAKKFCYWFNNDYVRNIIEERQQEK
jgi:DNA mismatch repair protein MutH